MAAEGQHEYTIKIIPHHGGEVKSARLSGALVKYGVLSLAVLSSLFVGAVGYATYTTLQAQSDAAEIFALREVNELRQKELTDLSRKANSIQDEVEALARIEEELQRIAGILPASDDDNTEESSSGGQGGPWIEPDVRNVNEALDSIAAGLEKRRESIARLEGVIKEQQRIAAYRGKMDAAIPSIWPSTGEVSSPFGMRWGGSDFHPGMDIADDYGTPIYATASGTVIEAGWNAGGYGNKVDIDHGNGIMTRYGHAREVVVTAGQKVRKGELIAYMGSTGFSTGPHVHYEIHVNGERVNPVSYLP